MQTTQTLKAQAKAIRGKIAILRTVRDGAVKRGDEASANEMNARLWKLETDLQGALAQIDNA